MQRLTVILKGDFKGPSHCEYFELSLADLESQGGSNVFSKREFETG